MLTANTFDFIAFFSNEIKQNTDKRIIAFTVQHAIRRYVEIHQRSLNVFTSELIYILEMKKNKQNEKTNKRNETMVNNTHK